MLDKSTKELISQEETSTSLHLASWDLSNIHSALLSVISFSLQGKFIPVFPPFLGKSHLLNFSRNLILV